MFPIRDSNTKGKGFAFFNYAIILLTIIIFFYQPTDETIDLFLRQWAIVPSLLDWERPATLAPLITSVFLHGNLLHLASNMWFLHIFGDNVEHDLGPLGYLVFYLAGGVAAAAAQLAFTDPNSFIPILGASGAISAVMGYYVVRFPRNTITILNPTLTYLLSEAPAREVLLIWMALQSINGLASAINGEIGGVAWWAHIGGFVFGVSFGLLRNSLAR